MSTQFLFYNGANGTFTEDPSHCDVPSPDLSLLKCLCFNPSEFKTTASVLSASSGILWLPFNSIVAAFAFGHGTNPPEEDLVPCATVIKNWHQYPNQHISLWLGWRDKDGNGERKFAMAHVHRNGMEVVFEAKTGGTLVRPYGQERFDWYEPGSIQFSDGSSE